MGVHRVLSKALSILRDRNLNTQQSSVILDLCLRKTREGKSHDYRESIDFLELRFENISLCTLKHKAGVLKFRRFEERLGKAPFS